jgi:phosphoribosylformylglycinamidine cyclo-ligase
MKNKAKITYDSVGISSAKNKSEMGGIGEYLKTSDKNVLNGLGPFASLYDLNGRARELGMTDPLLVLKMEEPGTKQLLATKYGYSESIAHDIVGHIVNDILVMGGIPVALLDCIVRGAENNQSTLELVKGFSDACKQNDMSLVGGEVSIQPGVMEPDTYVLSAALAGVVDRAHVIDGSKMQVGDVILAIASNGLHTNGYTLARKLMDIDPSLAKTKIAGETYLAHIMKPHLSYYPAIKDLLGKNLITGMAHITGGGMRGNLSRIINDTVSAEIDIAKLQILPIFQEIQKRSNNTESEMLRTFNCGVGLLIVAPEKHLDKISEHISKFHNCYIIGKITKNKNEKVIYIGETIWTTEKN